MHGDEMRGVDMHGFFLKKIVRKFFVFFKKIQQRHFRKPNFFRFSLLRLISHYFEEMILFLRLKSFIVFN